METSRNTKDIVAGLMFVGLAVVLGLQSYHLPLGTPTQLGPGAYPMLLIVILGVMGLAITVNGLRRRRVDAHAEAEDFVFAWKPLVLILLAPVLFGLLARGLGVVPALAIAVLLSTFAAPRFLPVGAVVATLVLVFFSWLIFIHFFALPWQAIGPWLGG